MDGRSDLFLQNNKYAITTERRIQILKTQTNISKMSNKRHLNAHEMHVSWRVNTVEKNTLVVEAVSSSTKIY